MLEIVQPASKLFKVTVTVVRISPVAAAPNPSTFRSVNEKLRARAQAIISAEEVSALFLVGRRNEKVAFFSTLLAALRELAIACVALFFREGAFVGGRAMRNLTTGGCE